MHLEWKLLSKYRNEIMGVAIIYVVLFHFYEIFNNLNTSNFSIQNIVSAMGKNGNIGVEIFLIVSGLGCFFSFYKNSNTKEFYKKRCLRVLITYTIIVLPYWFIYCLVLDKGTVLDIVFNFTGISFFTNQVATFWYIPFIMLMYFIFPLFYHYINKSNSFQRFLSLEILFIVFTIILNLIAPDFSKNIDLMTTRIVSFIAGIFIGLCIKKNKKIPVPIYIICILTVGLFFFDINYGSYLLYRYVSFIQAVGIIFIVVTLLSFISVKQVNSILAIAGKYSLEIYLLHIAIRRIMISLGFLTGHPEQYLIVVGLTILFSILVKQSLTLINRKNVI